MNWILGIDPGLSGGISFYNGTILLTFPTPLLQTQFVKNGKKQTRRVMDLELMVHIINTNQPDKAIIEKVRAMKGQGVSGMFRFGCNYGQYLGILTALSIPYTEVTPQKWKKHFGLDSDKNKSLELARKMFPDNLARFKRKKDDGSAESALIARYEYDTSVEHQHVPNHSRAPQELGEDDKGTEG